MNYEYKLDAAGSQVKQLAISGRFISIIEASGEFEINVPGIDSIIIDVADEIDLGDRYQDGLQVSLRNISGALNDVVIAVNSVYVSRKKVVEFRDDMNSVQVVGGEIALSQNAQNKVFVTNPVTSLTLIEPRYNVQSLSHIWTDDEDLTLNTGNVEKLILTTEHEIMFGDYSFIPQAELVLDRLAANQSLNFSGVAGNVLSIILFTRG